MCNPRENKRQQRQGHQMWRKEKKFYFRDLPAGRYRLSFVLDVAAVAKATCMEPFDLNKYSFSIGQAVLGQRLFSLEKVNIVDQCTPEGRREVRFTLTNSKSARNFIDLIHFPRLHSSDLWSPPAHLVSATTII